jgi:hypothetical protein
MPPLRASEAPAIWLRSSRGSCRSRLACTRRASASVVTSAIALAIGSCSAWASRSAATASGSALSSATITVSVGPAIWSIPTRPKTRRFASATKTLPGPTILSTRGTVSVPNAIAPTACAPPIANARSTPQTSAAASVAAGGQPSRPGGEQITTSSQPATRAGTAIITTVDG